MSYYQNTLTLPRRYQPKRMEVELPKINYSLLYGVIIGFLATFIIACMYIDIQVSYYQAKLDQASRNLETTYTELSATIDTYRTKLADMQAEWDELNAMLVAIEAQLDNETEYDFSLFDKYSYIADTAPENAGITIDLIAYNDELCKEADLNPHLIWAIVDTESSYNPTAKNANSSARGLGQFLESTARTFYEDERFLGHGEGSYDHDMITNPYLAVELMVEYLTYLRDTRGDDITSIIAGYRGKNDTYYFNDLASNMERAGSSIYQLTYN